MAGGLPPPPPVGELHTILHYKGIDYVGFDFNESTTTTIDDIRDLLPGSDVNLSENCSCIVKIYDKPTEMYVGLTNRYLRTFRPWQNYSSEKKIVRLMVENIPPEPQPSVQFVQQPDMSQNNDHQTSIPSTQDDNEQVINVPDEDAINEFLKNLDDSEMLNTGTSPPDIDIETLLTELNQLRLSFIADLREDQRFQYLSDSPTMLQSDKEILHAQRHPLLQIPDLFVARIEAGTPINLIVAVVMAKPIGNELHCYLAPHRGFLLGSSGGSPLEVKPFYNPFIWPIKKEQLKKITYEGKQITVIELKLCLMYPKGATKDHNPQLTPFDEKFILLKEHPVPSNVNQRSNRAETNSNEHIQDIFDQKELRLKCLLHTDGLQNGLDWSTCCESKPFFAERRQGDKRPRTMSSSQ